MKKYLLLVFCVLATATAASGQKIAVKNNLLGDAMLSPNLAVEFRMAPKWTLDTYVSWNPFFKSDRGIGFDEWLPEEDGSSLKMLKHLMVEPEVRFWTCEAFNGLFFGVHALGGIHSITGVKWPLFAIGDPDGTTLLKKENLYEGYFWGAGVSIGHQWIIGKRWNIEASFGAGYVQMVHDVMDPMNVCDPLEENVKFPMIWTTKATLSIVFLIK